MVGEATEDLVKEDVIFDCFVFSCSSIRNSMCCAVTVISSFQPNTQSPSHVFKEEVMATFKKKILLMGLWS
jgi:hypothetical protein